MFTITGFDYDTGNFILRNPWGATNGSPLWNITFESSAQELFGSNGRGGAFIINDSIGANGSAGQLTQVLAGASAPTVSTASVAASSHQNFVIDAPILAAGHNL